MLRRGSNCSLARALSYSPVTTPKTFSKRDWPGSRDSLNFSALNANNSKTIKATNVKFGTSVPGDSQDMAPKIIKKGAWPGSRDSLNFSAINANNSKTVKATDFKFGTNVPRDSPDMT